jgi:hypothetical protein
MVGRFAWKGARHGEINGQDRRFACSSCLLHVVLRGLLSRLSSRGFKRFGKRIVGCACRRIGLLGRLGAKRARIEFRGDFSRV